MPRRSAYPERLPLNLPRGYLARVDAAAQREDLSVHDWARAILKRALESAERQARRRKAAA